MVLTDLTLPMLDSLIREDYNTSLATFAYRYGFHISNDRNGYNFIESAAADLRQPESLGRWETMTDFDRKFLA